jgi:AcrR family transcriptional regulator
MSVTKGRRPADVAERTRVRIVDAALTLFSTRGFEAVSTRDIAAAAGTTHGLIRHHFGSKEGVWIAVVDAADATFRGCIDEVLADEVPRADGPEHALATIVRGLSAAAQRHPEIARLLLLEGMQPSARLQHILERIAPLRDLLDPLLPRLHARGELLDHDRDSLFLHLLMTAIAPFALAGLTAAVFGAGVGHDQTGPHAQRIVDTLLARRPD